MLARKRRTAKQRAALRYKQGAPLGIGLTRRQVKAAHDAAEAKQKRETHDHVWVRDPTCRYCEGRRWANRGDDQMHHDPPLSATRGQAPAIRTNTITCGRACPLCHEDLTGTIGRKMKTRFLSDRGFDGPIEGIMVSR